MFIIQSYSIAVVCCVVTMLCWGSWPSFSRMNPKWSFEYFYWDYIIGIAIISIILAFSLGSYGEYGRSFIDDISQASWSNLSLAFIGAVIWNIANICIFIAIQIAGMAVAFPISIGLSVVIGAILNYSVQPDIQSAWFLFSGMFFIVIAIIFDAKAYKLIQQYRSKSDYTNGIFIAIFSGILFGIFYLFFAKSMATDLNFPEQYKITPYTAMVMFAIGAIISNIFLNTYIMKYPKHGDKLSYKEYLNNIKDHGYGIIAGILSGLGTYLSFTAFGVAGAAISYGLGQGSTMIAVLWGLFIWKEFRNTSSKAHLFIYLMFSFYIIGLILIIISKV